MSTLTTFAAPDSRDALTIDRAARGRCEVVGRLKKIVLLDDVTGGFIGAIDCPAEGGEIRVRGNVPRGSVELAAGTDYKFYGKWVYHAKHGDQFLFSTFTSHFVPTRDGIIRYLHRLAPGVGVRRAMRLWDAFGPEAVSILKGDPAKVADAGIMSLDEATHAGLALASTAKHEDVKLALDAILGGYSFPAKIIPACIEKYGETAPDIIRADPYRLMFDDMPGAGFKRCDQLYLDLGLNPVAIDRQMWAAWYALKQSGNGNTWCVAGVALKAIVDCVGKAASRVAEAIEQAKKKQLIATKVDEKGREWLAEWSKARAERECARHIARLRHSPVAPQWPTREELEASAPDLSEHQRGEVSKVTQGGPFGILAGTPGTGKTFSAAAVLRFMVQRHGRHAIRVAAPTGKAAVRITEAMRRNGVDLEATTIHRLLAVGPNGFQHNEENPLEVSVVVVDEVSMLDVWLAASLFAALPTGTHVLLIGDPYQLAPVGHGAPLRDMIAAGVPCGLLTEIQRNAGMIVEACAKIKDGKRFKTAEKYDPEKGENLRWFEAGTPQEQVEMLRTIVTNMKLFDPIWQCQVLVARNEVTPVSRVELNKLLQGILNPEQIDPLAPTERMGHSYRHGDKIICLKNCFLNSHALDVSEVDTLPLDPKCVDSYREIRDQSGQIVKAFTANGEIGRVLAVAPRMIVVGFEEPARVVKIPTGKEQAEEADGGGSGDDGERKGAAGDFALAYAITTHKAQGSEAPCVIVIVDDSAGFVASREFHYTAISRAKSLCIVIGRRTTFERQVRRVALSERKTFLAELLRGEPKAEAVRRDRPCEAAGTIEVVNANEEVPL